MINAVGAINSGSDPEYLRILREHMQMGVSPSGNKNTDAAKLKKLKAELVQKIQTKQEEEQKQSIQVQPLEATKETQEKQKLEEERTGAMTLAELNKLYFNL